MALDASDIIDCCCSILSSVRLVSLSELENSPSSNFHSSPPWLFTSFILSSFVFDGISFGILVESGSIVVCTLFCIGGDCWSELVVVVVDLCSAYTVFVVLRYDIATVANSSDNEGIDLLEIIWRRQHTIVSIIDLYQFQFLIFIVKRRIDDKLPRVEFTFL